MALIVTPRRTIDERKYCAGVVFLAGLLEVAAMSRKGRNKMTVARKELVTAAWLLLLRASVCCRCVSRCYITSIA